MVAIIYGSSTCYTQFIAEHIYKVICSDYKKINAEIFNIKDIRLNKIEQYEYVIYAIPTWDYGELQEDWDIVWDDFCQLNLAKQRFAIVGVGDQLGYPDWFVDAMGYLFFLLESKNASGVGFWPLDDSKKINDFSGGYSYNSSKAILAKSNQWCGLPIDEENQKHLSSKRINIWLKQVLEEFGCLS